MERVPWSIYILAVLAHAQRPRCSVESMLADLLVVGGLERSRGSIKVAPLKRSLYRPDQSLAMVQG